MLETALHDVCKRLLDETMTLERDAAPALEKLADQVNSSTLERVRRVKGRMNSLTGRVAAVREELSKLLADDSDMMAMCLTMREEEAEAAAAAHSHQHSRTPRHSRSRSHGVDYNGVNGDVVDNNDNSNDNRRGVATAACADAASGRGGYEGVLAGGEDVGDTDISTSESAAAAAAMRGEKSNGEQASVAGQARAAPRGGTLVPSDEEEEDEDDEGKRSHKEDGLDFDGGAAEGIVPPSALDSLSFATLHSITPPTVSVGRCFDSRYSTCRGHRGPPSRRNSARQSFESSNTPSTSFIFLTQAHGFYVYFILERGSNDSHRQAHARE